LKILKTFEKKKTKMSNPYSQTFRDIYLWMSSNKYSMNQIEKAALFEFRKKEKSRQYFYSISSGLVGYFIARSKFIRNFMRSNVVIEKPSFFSQRSIIGLFGGAFIGILISRANQRERLIDVFLKLGNSSPLSDFVYHRLSELSPNDPLLLKNPRHVNEQSSPSFQNTIPEARENIPQYSNQRTIPAQEPIMSHSTEFQPELFTDYDKDPSYDDDFRYSTTSSSDDHLDDHTYEYINPEVLKNLDSFSIRK